MSKRRRKPPATAGPGAPLPTPPPTRVSLPATLGLRVLEFAVGKLMGFYAAILLGIGGLVLTIAWQYGPQRVLDADEFALLTTQKTGRIVESWLALEWNPAEMGDSLRWRAFAKATPCAVVEYQADWAQVRRAFCGNRLTFYEHYTLHDLKEMAPKVPFDWARDASGFAAPEIRLPAEALAWLQAQPSGDFFLSNAKPESALDDLRIAIDRPVDLATQSWGTPAPIFPLALDPKRPGEALPAGFLEARREAAPIWGLTVTGGLIGLVAWWSGVSVLLSGFHLASPVGRALVAIVPLLAVPWWGDEFPRVIRNMNPGFGNVIADMMGDIDITGRLSASDPADAVQVDGERLVWRLAEGRYADTFGKIRFVLPDPRPADTDEALAAIAEITATELRALPAPERLAIFERLTSDKQRDLRGAGFAFLPAARRELTDPEADEAVRRAAAAFLSAWVTQPVEEVWPSHPGYAHRLRLLKELTSLPIPEIANPAGWIWERGEKRR
ncbi:MAG TPA: hypothetical protein VI669_10430 [Vicinamibacteria bacterium]